MRKWYEIALDEKAVTCTMLVFFSACLFVLVYIKADEKYVIVFGSAITTLVGSLVRGTTHQAQTDSSQTVASTQTIIPKEEK
jgi:hypothetical protein